MKIKLLQENRANTVLLSLSSTSYSMARGKVINELDSTLEFILAILWAFDSLPFRPSVESQSTYSWASLFRKLDNSSKTNDLLTP